MRHIFCFAIVQDIASGYELPEQDFLLHVLPARSPGFSASIQRESVISHPGGAFSASIQRKPVVIHPGDVVTVDPARLVMTDPSINSYMIVKEVPSLGIFYKDDNTHRVELREGWSVCVLLEKFFTLGENVLFKVNQAAVIST